MGVGGRFWDLLKPYARYEGIDFLRGKRVAVDLPFWIVQHDTAIRARLPSARNPHLRTTFFRTIALFSKMGAFPVFVVDGTTSPLKNQARIERFFRGSGLDSSELAKASVPSDGTEKETPIKRNSVYARYIKECTELLELLGMPVLRADGEAEALCAQLNREGYVDACITADSDAFLFGAKCVIKSFRSNSKEPFECYNTSDIESGLGLKRNQMIAIALLVGSDHDLNGVLGFGVDTALRLVRLFSDDEIFDRLHQIGKGSFPDLEKVNEEEMDEITTSTSTRSPHCSNCGHPGSKKAHTKVACDYCLTNGAEFFCIEKPSGFKCICPNCDQEREIKEKKRHENWLTKVCAKIALEKNFPNDEIIHLYLKENHGDYQGTDYPVLRWDDCKLEELIDFLVYHQHWDPSYIRKCILPMESTIYLRKVADCPSIEHPLLCKQYLFDSIQRVKIQRGHSYYLVKWRRALGSKNFGDRTDEESTEEQTDPIEVNDPDVDILDEPALPDIVRSDNSWYLLTDENMELVKAAFPQEVERFQEVQRMKQLKSKEKKSSKSTGVQQSITAFYRSTKSHGEGSKTGETPKSRGKEKAPADVDQSLPKSVRRRLLFG